MTIEHVASWRFWPMEKPRIAPEINAGQITIALALLSAAYMVQKDNYSGRETVLIEQSSIKARVAILEEASKDNKNFQIDTRRSLEDLGKDQRRGIAEVKDAIIALKLQLPPEAGASYRKP